MIRNILFALLCLLLAIVIVVVATDTRPGETGIAMPDLRERFTDRVGIGEPVVGEEETLGVLAADGTQIVYVRPLARAKTLWDWMELLIAPAVLAAGGLWFTGVQRRRDRRLTERQEKNDHRASERAAQESELRRYIDRMSELLLEHGLGDANASDAVRDIARAHTLTILRRLDKTRVQHVLLFLHDTRLITGEEPRVRLDGLKLTGAHLRGAELPEITLQAVNLSDSTLATADLAGARLVESNFNRAKMHAALLRGANLTRTLFIRADLTDADLREADLTNADLSGADLAGAKLQGAVLEGANLADAKLAQAILDPEDT